MRRGCRCSFRACRPASESVTVAGAYGGLWCHPRDLADLRTGQVLDQDPITKASVVCSNADARYVTIDSVLPNGGDSISSMYERATGKCVSLILTQPATGMTFRLKLQGVQ